MLLNIDVTKGQGFIYAVQNWMRQKITALYYPKPVEKSFMQYYMNELGFKIPNGWFFMWEGERRQLVNGIL
jgi:hypothetical protein